MEHLSEREVVVGGAPAQQLRERLAEDRLVVEDSVELFEPRGGRHARVDRLHDDPDQGAPAERNPHAGTAHGRLAVAGAIVEHAPHGHRHGDTDDRLRLSGGGAHRGEFITGPGAPFAWPLPGKALPGLHTKRCG